MTTIGEQSCTDGGQGHILTHDDVHIACDFGDMLL